jgi:serine protease Do
MRQVTQTNLYWITWITAIISLGLDPSVKALNIDDVDAIASQTTVLIGQGLRKGDIEARQEWIPGSGVIIARQGNIYYALTALHVVRTRTVYGVRTNDGEVSLVDNSGGAMVDYLGEGGGPKEPINGFDLGVIKFESRNIYPIVTISRKTVELGETVYVSGWPTPEDESVTRIRRTSEGHLQLTAAQPFNDGGYSLLYSSKTRPGMSGGPVFTAAGEVVGIHGRGLRQGNEYCVDPEINRSNSCGMQMVHFLSQAESKHLRFVFNFDPVTSGTIQKGKNNKGKSDFISDIYRLFTFDLDTMLKVDPSGGCGSILLGEKCKDGL